MHADYRLIVTPGEPAGIGPDLILQYAQIPHSLPIVVIADRDLLIERAHQLGISINIQEYTDSTQHLQNTVGTLYVKHVPLTVPTKAGVLNSKNSLYVISCLDIAVDFCNRHANFAMVTGPVHKGIINDAGIPFTGHTEYLAELAGIELPVMMLATKGLRVALATTHLPLSQVSATITKPLLMVALT